MNLTDSRKLPYVHAWLFRKMSNLTGYCFFIFMWKVEKFKQSLLVAVTSLEFDSSKPNLTQIALIFENIILMSGACGPYLEDWQQCRERHLKGHTRYFYPMFSWDTRWSLASLLFLSSEHENNRAGCGIPKKKRYFACSFHLISKY